MRPRTYHSLFLYVILGIFLYFSFSPLLHAQQPIGGPYEPDSATVLLMHFEENFNNNHNPAFEIAEPNIFGNINFLKMDSASDLGYQVRFDNDSPEDNSHIQIPDTSALDLTGNWTIEMWVRVDSFGEEVDDVRRQPRLIVKPVDQSSGRVNYSIYAQATFNDLQSIYYSPVDTQFITVRTAQNVFMSDQWYHIAYIRDTSQQAVAQLVHQDASQPGQLPQSEDDSLDLVSYKVNKYGSNRDMAEPETSGKPLFLGAYPDHFYLDGAIDEVRISNTVRNFAVPAAIMNVTQLDNQPADQPLTLKADVMKFGATRLSAVQLHYKLDDQSWQTTEMSQQADGAFTAEIEGQPLGTEIRYWVSAQTESGYQTRSPERDAVPSQYIFATWRDSTEVLHLNFEQAEEGGPPVDQSMYKNNFKVSGSPTYPSVEGMGQVLQLSSQDSTSVSSDSPLLSLKQFAVDLTFQPQGSLPSDFTRLLVKESAEYPARANYQVFFYSSKVVVRVPDDYVRIDPPETPPHWTISDVTLKTDKWYRLWLSYGQDTLRAQLFNFSDTTFLGGRTVATGKHSITTDGRFRLGGMSGSGQWFNGQMGQVQLYNYVPDRFKETFTSVPQSGNSHPQQMKLGANYPNPFNPKTKIEFSLPQANDVKLTVYDVLGRRVAVLVDGKRQAGQHLVTFDASNLSSGVYIYRLKANGFSQSRKMLLVK